jgi:hypothetical protein
MKRVIYRESIVAFMDLLGFKALIASLKPRAVNQLRDLLKQAMAISEISADAELTGTEYYAKMFSDSVSMSIPARRSDPFQFLLHIACFQANLGLHGIFVRGAVVLGDHFEDERILFGPALVQAVDLEKTIALWPRVVIHPVLVKLCNNKETLEKRNNVQIDQTESLLQQDSAGITYLNYISFFYFKNEAEEVAVQFLRRHGQHIVKAAEANMNNFWVLHKYYWLATYYNGEVTRLGCPDLQIDMAVTFPSLY